jgi:Mn-dependent DtxR family transcriptional regulator
LAIATPDGRFSLTDAGRLEGSRVLRSDRLWQVFLSKYGESAALCSDLDADDVDRQLPADLLASLERELVEQNLWPAALPQPQPTGPAKDRGTR